MNNIDASRAIVLDELKYNINQRGKNKLYFRAIVPLGLHCESFNIRIKDILVKHHVILSEEKFLELIGEIRIHILKDMYISFIMNINNYKN